MLVNHDFYRSGMDMTYFGKYLEYYGIIEKPLTFILVNDEYELSTNDIFDG